MRAGRVTARGRAARLVALAGLLGAGVLLPMPASAVSGGTAADASYGFVAKVDVGVRACSGVLVDPHWVATASSCFAEDGQPVAAGPPPRATSVTVGRIDLSTTAGQTRAVTELVPHPERNVVLARLAAAVTDVTPVTLGTTPPGVGETLQVAGFGRTATEWVPDKLHVAPFTVEAAAAATAQIVGQNPQQTSTCRGDSGGPALRQTAGGLELVGLHSASWQRGCLGSTETRQGSTETRTDDLAGWFGASIAAAPDWQAGRALQIVNANNGKCLVVPSARTDHAASYWSCDTPYADQLWTVIPADSGYFQLKNANNGECLVAPTWGGGNIVSYPCNNLADQQWRITTGALQSQLQNRRNGQCLVAPSWAPNDVVLYNCGTPADQFWIQRGVGGGGTGQVKGLAGKCLDIPGAAPVDNTQLQLMTCGTSRGQVWTQSGVALTALGKCLEVRGSGTADGTAVQIAPCTGKAAQTWVTAANGALRNPNAERCLAVPNNNSGDGTKVIIWTCNGGADQRWTLP
ncbi:ricin-type beta-trefoil lectin domain protein [Micromonospora sp. NPDC018662]|uniref:ricin-type beta-trefoil lectin domain protein n=1 Tax=Micromonospora sp. NPDC018662 TaxID=3364238 RepID=UPI00378BBB54